LIKSRRVRWGGYVACMGKIRNTYRILVKILERKRQLGIQKNNIKIDFKEIGQNDVDWINLTVNVGKWRVTVKTVRKFWAP
jgi:hypothetical protein